MVWVRLKQNELVCVRLGCVKFGFTCFGLRWTGLGCVKFGLDYAELVSFGVCGSWFMLGLFRLCFVVLNQFGSTWIDLNSLGFISLGLDFVDVCGIV